METLLIIAWIITAAVFLTLFCRATGIQSRIWRAAWRQRRAERRQQRALRGYLERVK